jgi:hypothetical protein
MTATILHWWRTWGNLILGVWLISVTLVLVAVISVYSIDQRNTAENARASCERSQEFGPALARAYLRYRILTPEQVKAYRATIPTNCK